MFENFNAKWYKMDDLKNIKNEMESLKEQVLSSQQFLSDIIEISADAIIMTDSHQNIFFLIVGLTIFFSSWKMVCSYYESSIFSDPCLFQELRLFKGFPLIRKC